MLFFFFLIICYSTFTLYSILYTFNPEWFYILALRGILLSCFQGNNFVSSFIICSTFSLFTLYFNIWMVLHLNGLNSSLLLNLALFLSKAIVTLTWFTNGWKQIEISFVKIPTYQDERIISFFVPHIFVYKESSPDKRKGFVLWLDFGRIIPSTSIMNYKVSYIL